MLFKSSGNSGRPSGSTSDNNEDDLSDDTKAHTNQKVFDDIVNIRQDANAPQGDSSAIEQIQTRIIYIRDFGSIALSAEPLFPIGCKLCILVALPNLIKVRLTAIDQSNPLF